MKKTTRIWCFSITLIALLTACSTTTQLKATNENQVSNTSTSKKNGDDVLENSFKKSPGLTDLGSTNKSKDQKENDNSDQAYRSDAQAKTKDIAQKQIRNFRISGKIAVQTKQQSGSANVTWTEHGNQYSIAMMGPAGVGALNLYGRPGKVILQTSNGKTYVDKSPEHLLAKGWGYNVPVSHLKYWVRGLPSPDMSMSTKYDKKGQLRTLIQQGWVIQYLGYIHRGKLNLPTKIFIHSPNLQVKIVVYQWQV